MPVFLNDDVVEWIVIDFRRFIGVDVVVDYGIQRKVHIFVVVTVAAVVVIVAWE